MRLQLEIELSEIAGADDAVPADPDWMEHRHQIATNVEDAGPLTCQKPLMPVRCEKINWHLLRVERQDSQALNGIDQKIDSLLFQHFADCLQIIAEAARELDEAERHQAGAAVDGGA